MNLQPKDPHVNDYHIYRDGGLTQRIPCLIDTAHPAFDRLREVVRANIEFYVQDLYPDNVVRVG